ncbi:MAG TPA: PEP/pyruvate-binding domain-containing protein [Saprospiraceae bacterium]|nr:PEP/pyruvate-binding domain-containing protein [Saprospiraceae bacterium]
MADSFELHSSTSNSSLMRSCSLFYLLILNLFITPIVSNAQVSNPEQVKGMISRYKTEIRGPYNGIRWFCKDGTNRDPHDPCPDHKGAQHARLKDEVIALGKKDHVFLGQILAMTDNEDFWDAGNAQSRLKQYQLELYLRNVDNGWINRQAQYYRGAVQNEDETNWGVEFYKWLLEDTERIRSQFFLIRESAKDIPHAGDNNDAQLVRALSAEIADELTAFQELRIKIHGIPDASDIQRVRDFQEKNKNKITPELAPKFDQLIADLKKMYRPFQVSDFATSQKNLPKGSEAARILENFTSRYGTMDCPPDQCKLISRAALQLRREILKPMRSSSRLALIDVSNKLESLLNKDFTLWKPEYLSDLLEQVYCLSEAAAAFGFLELWEWDQIRNRLSASAGDTITLAHLSDCSETGRHVAEWGAGMVRAHYMPVINLYHDFEPLAAGFYDDRVRSSVLLPLGRVVSWLGDEFSHKAGFSNQVLDIKNQSSIHGLNAGFTVGELIVVTDSPENVELSPDKIYVFHHPPANLKPVAGIGTVTEGNTVSHIQLLARNLGIPNAVFSQENMDALKSFSGKKVFYAVSNKGTVIMKLESDMTDEERKLFEKKKRSEEKISVPIGKIELNNPHVLNLNTINASNSGKTCGPKAANLGQLKQMFPENVVEGLVVPFAVFRQHMNQTIPGQETNYWAMMIGIFDKSECMRCDGATEPEIEKYTLQRLDSLRVLIKMMPFLPSFREELQQQFNVVFGKPIGQVPVFVRSDTNMEDLKDFTGAGLNLTVFNVVDPDKIFQGIRDVWASPYTERSFRWRQRYLNNPENVFPSIVIIPSVDGDKSGVMITKGITTGNNSDLTVAFNYGVGGAVDGQAAESWLLDSDCKDHLLSPAREPSFLTIPATGGSVRKQASFEERILTPENIDVLRMLAEHIRYELPGAPGVNTKGPFDMELGFKDNKLWLFQVRPFVENKQAAASEFLQNITPAFDAKRTLIL